MPVLKSAHPARERSAGLLREKPMGQGGEI